MLIGSAALALVVSLVIAAFSFAGILGMTLAHVSLFLAWAVATIALCALEYVWKRDKTSHIASAYIVVVAATSFIFSGLDLFIYINRPFDPYSDVIEAGNKKIDPDSNCSDSRALLTAQLGALTSLVYNFPHVFLRIGGKDVLWVELGNNGEPLINVEIFDKDANIIAAIKRNVLHVNKNNVFYAESLNRHSIQIFDKKDRQVLNLDISNKNYIKMTGSLYYGPGFVVNKDALMGPRGLEIEHLCSKFNGIDIIAN